jgi:hypothetical protein
MREQRFVRRILVFSVVALSLAIAVAARALDATAIERALRLQGRLSFFLYIAGLIGPGLHALSAARLTAWLARQRPPLYLAFALSHLIHGAWIVLYFRRTSASFSWNLPDTSGLLAFLAIALLLYAETPHGQRRLPLRARIEAIIAGYVWLQFAGFFIDRMQAADRVELRPWYVLALSGCVVAAVVSAYGGRHAARAPAPLSGLELPRARAGARDQQS